MATPEMISDMAQAAGSQKQRPRLLFIDRDTSVLSGFRRLLSLHAPDWDGHFITPDDGPEAALNTLEPDILITDFIASDAPFLNVVRAHHPKTIRIALVGHYVGEHVHAALTSAHLILAKPCDSRQLIHHIQTTLGMQAALSSRKMQELVASVGELPSPPDTYLRVQDLLNSGDTSADELAGIIEHDPVLTAKILQIANSAIFAQRRPAASLLDAVRLFGFEGIRGLIATESVTRQVQDKEFAQGFDLTATWTHSFVAASLGRAIAREERQDISVGDHAFLAGLLHDIGTLIFATGLPHDYAKIIEEAQTSQVPIAEIEIRHFGIHHGHIGAYLLSLWGLPHDVVLAIANHHDDATDLLEHSDVVGVPEILCGIELLLRQLNGPERESATGGSGPLPPRLRTWRKLALKMLDKLE